jgi:hypothetical protein
MRQLFLILVVFLFAIDTADAHELSKKDWADFHCVGTKQSRFEINFKSLKYSDETPVRKNVRIRRDGSEIQLARLYVSHPERAKRWETSTATSWAYVFDGFGYGRKERNELEVRFQPENLKMNIEQKFLPHGDWKKPRPKQRWIEISTELLCFQTLPSPFTKNFK